MHARELSELAGWAAFSSSKMVFGTQAQVVFATNKYWTNTKCRHQRWMTVLKMFEMDLDDGSNDHDPIPAMEIVIQEVILSEMLSRVWSATLLAHDRYHKTDELSGVAHSIHVSQIEAKNRCLRLLLRSDLQDNPVVRRCNQLRNKIERWTDMLLGEIPDEEAATIFAFEPSRVKDFIRENSEASETACNTRQALYSAALTKDLKEATSSYIANPSFNKKIAAGILACFPADRFDSTGLPKSVQVLWIENSSDDTQLLLDGLHDMDKYSLDSFGFGR